MKIFAQLINSLESSNKTTAKIDAIIEYLESASERDKLWLILLFTGKRPKRNINTNLLREWSMELANIPAWLFTESYSAVGDLGETIALILPPAKEKSHKSLDEWMLEIIALKDKSDAEKKAFVLNAWEQLDNTERFIFNKLIGGSFRIGVSHKMLVNAIAKYTNRDAGAFMHAIMGKWNVDSITFDELVNAENVNADNSKLYPFCLAYPLEKKLEELGLPQDWMVEYKWDGIRGQIIKRNNEIYIWSRGEELVTTQFPELEMDFQKIDGDFVLDGEILVVNDGVIQNFNELQKRLNRKSISKKMMDELPIAIIIYDILEFNQKDIRNEPLEQRRKLLEQWHELNKSERIILSKKLIFDHWDALESKRSNARDINAEGLMLKKNDSIYHAGRKIGDWWKWKMEPMTIDAVLIYAQKGSGRRSGYYTDYTFAVKNGDELVTIAKAYSGLTDKEIMEVSRFVTQNSIEKFGPVRTVKAELVFEIAFEGIGYSKRHKSGIALRFPRIVRWRKDKTVNDIDTIESVRMLIQ